MRRLTLTLLAAQMVTMTACMTDNFDPNFPSPDASAPLSDAYPMDRGVPDTSLNPDAMAGSDSTTPRDAEGDADSTLTADAVPPMDATVSMDVSPLQDAALVVDATPDRDSRPLIDADLEVDTGQQPQDSGVVLVDSQPPARDMEVETTHAMMRSPEAGASSRACVSTPVSPGWATMQYACPTKSLDVPKIRTAPSVRNGPTGRILNTP